MTTLDKAISSLKIQISYTEYTQKGNILLAETRECHETRKLPTSLEAFIQVKTSIALGYRKNQTHTQTIFTTSVGLHQHLRILSAAKMLEGAVQSLSYRNILLQQNSSPIVNMLIYLAKKGLHSLFKFCEFMRVQ